MSIKNLIITILMLSLAGYGGLKLYMWKQAKQDVDQVFNGINYAMTATYGLRVIAKYKQISTSVFGPIGIKGISIRIPELDSDITIAEIKLLERDLNFDLEKGNLPLRIHFVINGLHMNVSLYNKLGDKLKKLKLQRNIKEDPNALVTRLGYRDIARRSNDLLLLGYNKLDMDIEVDMNLDAKTKEASLFFCQDTKDLGQFTMTLKVVDMSNKIDNAVMGLRIKEAKLEFMDNSYLDRFIKSYADDENMTLSVFRKKLISDIKQDFVNKKIKLSESSVKSIQAFVNKPGKIVFTVYPYHPVGIESLKHYKVGDIPTLLNLQAHLE